MLAQNFMTAADLQLSEEQHDALRKVLVLLETGKLRHIRELPPFHVARDHVFSGLFNMNNWGPEENPHPCGTIGCIGGTAELISGKPLFRQRLGRFERAGHTPGLRGLFYPDCVEDEWEAITPEQAARALRNYLTTGEARWLEVMA